MKETTKRSIFRWIHIIFGIPIIGTFIVPLTKSQLRFRSAVFLSSCNSSFGIVDVEGSRSSTTYLEELNLIDFSHDELKREPL